MKQISILVSFFFFICLSSILGCTNADPKSSKPAYDNGAVFMSDVDTIELDAWRYKAESNDSEARVRVTIHRGQSKWSEVIEHSVGLEPLLIVSIKPPWNEEWYEQAQRGE